LNQQNIAYVLKDRSDTINGKSFVYPTFKQFSPIVNFILGLEIGEIAKETSDINLTPGNDRNYFELQQNRKIEIEKIESVFELNNLGGNPRSAADKKVKTAIIQKVFKTTSKTEIEKMLPQELNYRRQELEELFKEIQENQPDDIISYITEYSMVS